MLNNILSFAALIGFSVTASAGIDFSVGADRTNVASGEQITITAKAVSTQRLKSISQPPLTQSESFTLLRTSQNQSQQSSIQIINGKMTQSEEITYLFYYWIAPKKEGTFTFPALTLTADGQTFTSQPFPITVTKEPVVNPDLRVSLHLNKNKLFVGEQGLLTLEVAVKPNASSSPTNEGFTAAIQALDASGKDFSLNHLFANNINKVQKQIGGETYVVFIVPFSLIPLKSGSSSIGPVPFQYEVLIRGRRDAFDDFFGGVFGGGVQRVAKNLVSNTISFQATALPPPPSDFSGSVGTFSLSVTAEPREVAAGDASTLTINLRGSTRPGNMTDIVLPQLDRFEVFSPEKHISTDTTAQGIQTRKTYKYLIIPKEEGVTEIPSIRWVYFDPSTASYKTASSVPIPFTVTKGKQQSKQNTRYLTQEEIREVGADIRYIKTPPKPATQSAEPQRNPIFFILYPLPFFIVLFSLLYKIQAQHRQQNSGRTLRSRAFGQANKALSKLLKQQPQATLTVAASQISDIVLHYLTHRLSFAAVGKTLDEIREELSVRNTDETMQSAIIAFLEELDTLRFNPSATVSATTESLAGKARAIIIDMEKNAKAVKK